jgi:Fe2+ or Zn2+ uptake regulation protein
MGNRLRLSATAALVLRYLHGRSSPARPRDVRDWANATDLVHPQTAVLWLPRLARLGLVHRHVVSKAEARYNISTDGRRVARAL